MAVPWFHTPTPPLIRWHLFLGHLALLCIPALSGFGDTISGAWVDYPLQKLPLHALRIGGFALATAPCELYCQFGIDIKRRSPAAVTAVTELTHGTLGYCPTAYGILGGGYSGATYYGCKLEPLAGYRMVDELAKMLFELFR